MASTAPVRKPASGPSAIPVIITIPVSGLKNGTMIKAAREATATALMTAIVTSSRACGFLCSKRTKNGSIA